MTKPGFGLSIVVGLALTLAPPALAEQGEAEAQWILGTLYENGQGMPQDYTEAVKWYRRAAEQGHASAQNSLGTMYLNGEGVPQDYQVRNMGSGMSIDLSDTCR